MVIRKGQNGLHVTNLQTWLVKFGLLSGLDVDGDFGNKTLSAVIRFQLATGLVADGLVGDRTQEKLSTLEKLPEVSTEEVISRSQVAYVFKRDIEPHLFADLNSCLQKFQINTPKRIRHFIAQIAHESGGLRYLEELASGDAYEPHTEVGKALGNIYPGDGRKYKGGGAGQLTGKYNYQRFADFMGDDRIMEGTSYVAATYPVTSFGFWWQDNELNRLIDAGADCREVSARVNGTDPANGLVDRLYCFERAFRVI